MKFILFFLLAVMLSIIPVTAADNADEGPKTQNKKDDESGKKVYTEEEFGQAVLEQVEKKLKRIGRSRIVDFSKELFKKEEELKMIGLKLEKEREQFNINVKGFEKKIVEFQERQSKFIGWIDKQESENKKRTGHIVEIVSGMRPVKAAEVLSVQDPEITVKILGFLPPAKVSKIFNVMDKEVSARLQKQYLTMKK